jgi:RsiW-degrading membrane proteinase PrsW (M82 family)
VLLYASLALCALIVAVIVYRYDLYDREPIVLLVLATAAGAGAMWLAGRVEVIWLTRVWPDRVDSTPLIASLAGTHEEAGKLLVVVLIAVVFRSRFNDPMDGLIYGSFAGLGAAIEESFAVLERLGPESLPPQEPVRLMGHLVMGGIGSAGVGLWKGGVRRGPVVAACTFGLAVGVHILWDLVAVPAQSSGSMSGARTVAAVAVMALGLVCYAGLVVAGSAASRRVFAPGSRRRVWGWPFTRSHAAEVAGVNATRIP